MFGVEAGFLFHLVQTRDFLEPLNAKQRGTSYPAVRDSDVFAQPVALPPLNEQRRIVEKIEELFTKLDAGVRSLKQIQALLKSYRRSVLKAAVEGELSREWREAHRGELEPASDLLERILQERREKFAGKKYKEPASPDTSELPPLPDGWEWASVDHALSEPMVNGLSVKGSDSPPGVAALKLDAMTANGLNFARSRYLPIDTTKAENLWIREGDFFISRGNGTLSLVGRGSLAQEPPFPAIFPDTMIRARIADILHSTSWIPAIWQSSFIRRQIENRAKTTAGIHKVSQADLKSIALPVPPLEEQRFIVEEVERRLSVVDKLEATVAANLKQAGGLRQSILKRAFSGKLVPQYPEDEPAGLLLERIRSERRATKQKVKRPKAKNEDGLQGRLI